MDAGARKKEEARRWTKKEKRKTRSSIKKNGMEGKGKKKVVVRKKDRLKNEGLVFGTKRIAKGTEGAASTKKKNSDNIFLCEERSGISTMLSRAGRMEGTAAGT